MNMKPQSDVCIEQDCPKRLGDAHHHVQRASNPDVFETHPGKMHTCLHPMCTSEQTFKKGDPVQDERINAVQEDLVNQAAEIAGWWVKTAQGDAERTVPKAVEYGAADFDLMGQFMVALMGDKLDGADDAEKMKVGREMAVVFYLIGKMGRMVGAYAQGVLPSDDTLFDTNIYSMMLRRIRETGHWIK